MPPDYPLVLHYADILEVMTVLIGEFFSLSSGGVERSVQATTNSEG